MAVIIDDARVAEAGDLQACCMYVCLRTFPAALPLRECFEDQVPTGNPQRRSSGAPAHESVRAKQCVYAVKYLLPYRRLLQLSSKRGRLNADRSLLLAHSTCPDELTKGNRPATYRLLRCKTPAGTRLNTPVTPAFAYMSRG